MKSREEKMLERTDIVMFVLTVIFALSLILVAGPFILMKTEKLSFISRLIGRSITEFEVALWTFVAGIVWLYSYIYSMRLILWIRGVNDKN